MHSKKLQQNLSVIKYLKLGIICAHAQEILSGVSGANLVPRICPASRDRSLHAAGVPGTVSPRHVMASESATYARQRPAMLSAWLVGKLDVGPCIQKLGQQSPPNAVLHGMSGLGSEELGQLFACLFGCCGESIVLRIIVCDVFGTGVLGLGQEDLNRPRSDQRSFDLRFNRSTSSMTSTSPSGS